MRWSSVLSTPRQRSSSHTPKRGQPYIIYQEQNRKAKRISMKNPQAFPSIVPNDSGRPEIYRGMSLLDHFAGQALASIDNTMWVNFCSDSPKFYESGEAGTAEHCYNIAEAMLKEREKRSN